MPSPARRTAAVKVLPWGMANWPMRTHQPPLPLGTTPLHRRIFALSGGGVDDGPSDIWFVHGSGEDAVKGGDIPEFCGSGGVTGRAEGEVRGPGLRWMPLISRASVHIEQGGIDAGGIVSVGDKERGTLPRTQDKGFG